MTKILEVNEDGSLMIPADLLNGAEPHQRYTAESEGKNLLLRPESESVPIEKLDPEELRRRWIDLSDRVGRLWPANTTAADVISEMRR
jgi:hypothetical protein